MAHKLFWLALLEVTTWIESNDQCFVLRFEQFKTFDVRNPRFRRMLLPAGFSTRQKLLVFAVVGFDSVLQRTGK